MRNVFSNLVGKSTLQVRPVIESFVVQFAFHNWKSIIWKEFHIGSYKGQLEISGFHTIKSTVFLVMTFATVVLMFYPKFYSLPKRERHSRGVYCEVAILENKINAHSMDRLRNRSRSKVLPSASPVTS